MGLAERDKEKQAMKSVDERSHCQGGQAEWKYFSSTKSC